MPKVPSLNNSHHHHHGGSHHHHPMSLHKLIFVGLVVIAVMVTGRTVLTGNRSAKSGGAGGGLGFTLKGEEEKKGGEAAAVKAKSATEADKTKDTNRLTTPPPPAASTSTTTTTAANPPPPQQLQVYPTIPPLPNNQERKIMLIHLGKSGGNTFKKNTAVGCWDEFPTEADLTKREECFEQYGDHMKLAKLTRDVVHIDQIDDAKVEQATSFVLVVRDPVERIISSYRSAHPENCDDSNGAHKTHGCSLMEKNLLESGTLGFTMFKKCFPSPGMEDFAQAILPPYEKVPQHWTSEFTNDEIAECRKLARQMVQGLPNNGMDPHMENNYEHFQQATYRKYPKKEFFALRTEQIMQDMKRLDRMIGGQGQFMEETANYRMGSENFKPSPLSDSSLHKLCCVLEKELNVYFDVFVLAKNLDADDRKEANFRLRSTCGLWDGEAWYDWRTRCWKLMEEPIF